MKTKQCYENHTKCNKDYCERQPTHTPTPWKVGNGATIYNDELTRMIAILDDLNSGDNREINKANASFIVKAVNSHEALLEFAKKHHEICEECEGNGKVYNNTDPTSGQWVQCPYETAIAQAEGE